MLIGGMVQHHFDDDAQPALVGYRKKALKVLQRSIAGMNGPVIGNVIADVSKGRRKEGHQPYRIDTQLLKIIQPLRETCEIANAVPVGIVEGAHMHLINDCVLVPAWFELWRQRIPPRTRLLPMCAG